MRFAVCISIGGLRNHVREKHFEEGPSVRSRILSPGTELLSERNSCLEPHSVSPCHRWAGSARITKNSELKCPAALCGDCDCLSCVTVKALC